jgi:hypothetical protein
VVFPIIRDVLWPVNMWPHIAFHEDRLFESWVVKLSDIWKYRYHEPPARNIVWREHVGDAELNCMNRAELQTACACFFSNVSQTWVP